MPLSPAYLGRGLFLAVGKTGANTMSVTENYKNDTYKAIRVMGNGYDLMYTTWCTNEHELYDMTVRLSSRVVAIRRQ